MPLPSWLTSFPGAITVTDERGVIIFMNDKSIQTFAKEGGERLLGKSVLDCHPEPSRSKLERMLAEHTPNTYTIEKNGARKLIYQTPWFEDGQYRGFIELSLEIPWEMPHFVRK